MYRRHARRRRRTRRQPVGFLLVLLVIMITAVLIFLNAGGKSSYRKGMKAFQNETYEEAGTYFEKAISKNADCSEYRNAYGMTLVQLGKYEKAANEFTEAVSEKTSKSALEQNKEAYRGLGICYFFAKKYENSIYNFDLSLAINELYYLNVDILKYKAEAEMQLGNYENAIAVYTQIIDEEDKSSDMYLKRAYAYSAASEVEQAVADFDYVIEKDEDNFNAYLGAYTLLMSAGEDEKADSYLEQALRITPDTTNEKLIYAVIQYYYYGITEEAQESLEALVTQGEVEAYFYLAKISYSEGDLEQVSSYLNSYVSNDSAEHLAEAYEMLGRTAMLGKDYEAALAWFEEGIACDDVQWTQVLKKDQIAVYEYLSDFEKAYEIATEYLTDFPEDQDIKRELDFIETRLS